MGTLIMTLAHLALNALVFFYLAVSLAMEAIGDITASAEVSRVPVDGEEFDTRIQGGVLVRGISYYFTRLFCFLAHCDDETLPHIHRATA